MISRQAILLCVSVIFVAGCDGPNELKRGLEVEKPNLSEQKQALAKALSPQNNKITNPGRIRTGSVVGLGIVDHFSCVTWRELFDAPKTVIVTDRYGRNPTKKQINTKYHNGIALYAVEDGAWIVSLLNPESTRMYENNCLN